MDRSPLVVRACGHRAPPSHSKPRVPPPTSAASGRGTTRPRGGASQLRPGAAGERPATRSPWPKLAPCPIRSGHGFGPTSPALPLCRRAPRLDRVADSPAEVMSAPYGGAVGRAPVPQVSSGHSGLHILHYDERVIAIKPNERRYGASFCQLRRCSRTMQWLLPVFPWLSLPVAPPSLTCPRHGFGQPAASGADPGHR